MVGNRLGKQTSFSWRIYLYICENYENIKTNETKKSSLSIRAIPVITNKILRSSISKKFQDNGSGVSIYMSYACMRSFNVIFTSYYGFVEKYTQTRQLLN